MNLKKALIAAMMPVMALTACDSATSPKSSNTTAIEERQDTMKNWKDSKDIMREVVTDEKLTIEERLEKIKEHAQYMADSSETIWEAFGNSEEKGNAQDAIWENTYTWKAETEAFNEAVKDFNELINSENAASQMNQVDLAASYSRVENSCKSCHEQFKM